MEIIKELIKIFEDWTKLKIRIHVSEANKNVYFKEGQVWLAHVGQNIGVEANGKNENFERPIIIIKKFNGFSFLGVTMSSKSREGKYYIELKDNSRTSSFANLSQLKLMSAKRLIRNVRDLPEKDFELIRNKIKEYI